MAFDYIELGSQELLNPSRTLAYIRNHLPGLDVEVNPPSIMPYTNPLADTAPWITSDPNSHVFYGGLTDEVTGLRDSTQSSSFTELSGDGAVTGLRRNASREIRVVTTLYAKTEAGLRYGIDWFTHALSGGYCPEFGVPYCEGEQLTILPLDTEGLDYGESRVIHDVKTLQNVRLMERLNYRNAKAIRIEFLLIAGNPFIFRSGALSTQSLAHQGFEGEFTERFCDPETESYDQMITDPSQGDVVRPPRPPQTNVVPMPDSWRRGRIEFPREVMNLPGQAVFRIRVSSNGAIRRLRLRFYRAGNSGTCDYSGEFFITYKPGGEDMVIDGVTRKIWIERGGRALPAGNLVVGSDARPMEWPIMDCQEAVVVRAEYPSIPTNLNITVEAHNRR